MKTTRVRKKGCPFCKKSPEFCYPVIDLNRFSIVCSDCGAKGPGFFFTQPFGYEPLSEAWIKWNHRG